MHRWTPPSMKTTRAGASKREIARWLKIVRLLFWPKNRSKPGPKGPDQDLIKAVIEMKQRNPRWGCPRIAEQLALAFGVLINKDVVRWILGAHYQPSGNDAGPSWLTLISHAKDSLHSIDLFRCESVTLRTYWVLVVMDQYTRRIVGFGIHAGIVDGVALCRMFNQAIRGQATPKYLSSDHDPLYRFHQWQANLRVLGVTEIKTVPYVPISHPFVERLIGTIRSEYLDHSLFWNAVDLESKLVEFKDYYNRHRTHCGLSGKTPEQPPRENRASLKSFAWRAHCSGLFHTPIAA
jgi:putative transposase